MICNPVGDPSIRTYPPAPWKVSNGYRAKYTLSGRPTIHTGNDLNLTGTSDVDQPVRSIADGVVIYAQYLSTSTWLGLVVIKHVIGGKVLFSRYGHMRPPVVKKNQTVTAGQQIGVVSPTAGTVATFEPHCHFDTSQWDDTTLEKLPTDWPGSVESRIIAHYQDPLKLLPVLLTLEDDGNGTGNEEIPPVGLVLKQCKVITSVNLTLREWPDADSAKIISIPPGSTVMVSPIIKSSEDGYVWTYAWHGVHNGWLATADKAGQPWLEGFQ